MLGIGVELEVMTEDGVETFIGTDEVLTRALREGHFLFGHFQQDASNAVERRWNVWFGGTRRPGSVQFGWIGLPILIEVRHGRRVAQAGSRDVIWVRKALERKEKAVFRWFVTLFRGLGRCFAPWSGYFREIRASYESFEILN